jgi:hypothetical protein
LLFTAVNNTGDNELGITDDGKLFQSQTVSFPVSVTPGDKSVAGVVDAGEKVSINDTALQRKSHLSIPFLGIARPQPQFPHSCVCERFI